MLTPPQVQEAIARHFDHKAEKAEAGRDYGGKVIAQVWRWVAARVREVPAAELVSEDETQ